MEISLIKTIYRSEFLSAVAAEFGEQIEVRVQSETATKFCLRVTQTSDELESGILINKFLNRFLEISLTENC